MRVEVDTVQPFGAVAQQQARTAATFLNRLTGECCPVTVSTVSITSAEAIEADSQTTLSQVWMNDGFGGTAVLRCSSTSAQRLSEAVSNHREDESTVRRFAETVVGRIGAETAHQISTAKAPGTGQTRSDSPRFDDHVFLLACELTVPKLRFDFELVIEVAAELMVDIGTRTPSGPTDPPESRGPPTVTVDDVGRFGRHVERGVAHAGDEASIILGHELTAEPERIRFLPLAEISHHVGASPGFGAGYALSEPPGGFVAIDFDPASLDRVDSGLVGSAPSGGLDGMTKTAVLEVATAFVSGLLSGWAELLDESLDHSPPTVLDGQCPNPLEPFADWVATGRRFGFAVAVTLATPAGPFCGEVYAVPDSTGFLEAIDRFSGQQRLL